MNSNELICDYNHPNHLIIRQIVILETKWNKIQNPVSYPVSSGVWVRFPPSVLKKLSFWLGFF